MKKQSKHKFGIGIETILILMIAVCILFINSYTVRKLNELENNLTTSVFIKQDLKLTNDEVIAEEIKNYIPDSCKMVELYDEQLNMLFQAHFNDPADGYVTNDIRDYPKLSNLFFTKEEGQAMADINGTEESIYFKWLTNTRGERRLLIIYSAIKKVEGIWVFSLACYITLILVFILLIKVNNDRYNDKIKQYHDLIKSSKNDLINLL